MTIETFYMTSETTDIYGGSVTNPEYALANDSNYANIISTVDNDENYTGARRIKLTGVKDGATINSVKVKGVFKFDSSSGTAEAIIYCNKVYEYTKWNKLSYDGDCPTTDTVIEYTDLRSWTLTEVDEMQVEIGFLRDVTSPTQMDVKYLAVEIDYTNPDETEGYTEEFNTSVSLDVDIPSSINVTGICFSQHTTQYMAVTYDGGAGVRVYKRGSTQWEKIADPSTTPESLGGALQCGWAGDYLVIGLDASPRIVAYKIDTSTDTLTKIADPSGANTPPDESVMSLDVSPDGNYIGVGTSASGETADYGFMMTINTSTDTWERVTMPTFPSNTGSGGNQGCVNFNGNSDMYVIGNLIYPYQYVYELSNGTWSERTETFQSVQLSVTDSIDLSKDGSQISRRDSSGQLNIKYFDDSNFTTWYKCLGYDIALNDDNINFLKRSNLHDYIYTSDYNGTNHEVVQYYSRAYTVDRIGAISPSVTNAISNIAISENGRYLAYSDSDNITVLESDEIRAVEKSFSITHGTNTSLNIEVGVTGDVSATIGDLTVISTDINKNISVSSSIGDNLSNSFEKSLSIDVSSSIGDNLSINFDFSKGVSFNLSIGDNLYGNHTKEADISIVDTNGDRINIVWQYDIEQSLSVGSGLNMTTDILKGLDNSTDISNGDTISTGYEKGIDDSFNVSHGINKTYNESINKVFDVSVSLGDNIYTDNEKTIDYTFNISNGDNINVEILNEAVRDITISLGDTISTGYEKGVSESVTISSGGYEYLLKYKNINSIFNLSHGSVIDLDLYKSLINAVSISVGINHLLQQYKSISDIVYMQHGENIYSYVSKNISSDTSDILGIDDFVDISIDKLVDGVMSTGVVESMDITRENYINMVLSNGVNVVISNSDVEFYRVKKVFLTGVKNDIINIDRKKGSVKITAVKSNITVDRRG